MALTQQATLFEHDPEAYWVALDAYINGWEGDEEERNATYWLAHAVNPIDDDSIFRIVALGYIVGSYESWSRSGLSERIGLFANLREKEERELAETGIEGGAFNLVYGCRIFSARIADLAVEDDSTQGQRLDLAFQRLVIEKFETSPSAEEIPMLRSVFDLGVAQRLYWLWQVNMDELGLDEDERWADLEFASEPYGGDRLAELEVPLEIRGCVVDLTDTLGYEIRSERRMGGHDVSVFLAHGDRAEIITSAKTGRSGSRKVKTPHPRHIDVLRDLGYTTATFPNGEEYRLSSWGGLSGVRRVKE